MSDASHDIRRARAAPEGPAPSQRPAGVTGLWSQLLRCPIRTATPSYLFLNSKQLHSFNVDERLVVAGETIVAVGCDAPNQSLRSHGPSRSWFYHVRHTTEDIEAAS